jgi:hypothetical protein
MSRKNIIIEEDGGEAIENYYPTAFGNKSVKSQLKSRKS